MGEARALEKLDSGPSIGNDVFSKIASSSDRELTILPRIDKQQCLETLMLGMKLSGSDGCLSTSDIYLIKPLFRTAHHILIDQRGFGSFR